MNNAFADFPDIPAKLDRRPKPEVTFGALVARHQELKTWVEGESRRFSEHMKPVKEEMESILNQLLDMLNRQKLENVRTDAGTAYKSTTMSPKVADRDAYLDWCNEHWDEGGNEMLQVRAPQVDAIREYMQANDDKLPPGVSVEYNTSVNIRKS